MAAFLAAAVVMVPVQPANATSSEAARLVRAPAEPATITAAAAAPVDAGVTAPGPPTAPPNPGPCTFSGIPTVEEAKSLIETVAAEEAFPKDLLLSIARQESGFHMDRVSSAGAIGIMQLMPATAARFNVDICEARGNIRGAIQYLRVLLKQYDNPIYVLAAYNAGETAVERNRGIPIYPETVRYVAAVMTDLYGWKPIAAREKPMNRARRAKSASPPADAPPAKTGEAWSQGFVLHVDATP